MSEAPKPENTQYFFNHNELGRLAVYRAAVLAKFYTDQCDSVRESREFSNLMHRSAAESGQTQPPTDSGTVSGDIQAPNSKPGIGS